MENIMEVTTRALQGPLLERLSLQTHENEGAIRRGMERAVPISIAGLAAHASSEQNAERLLGALRAGNYPHVDAVAIGQTTTSPEATSRLVQSGSTFLRGILGPNKHDTAVDTIAGSSGVSKSTAMTLLGLSAPVVLHAVGKEADERHLDAHGLSQFLAEQGKTATTGLPPTISSMFGESRGGVQRVEQRTKSSINEARERLRATIDERQRRDRGAQVAEPHKRRFGAWIAVALAVLAAILLIGRRNVPRQEGTIESGRRIGEQVTRGGDEMARQGGRPEEGQQVAQPGTPAEPQPQQAQPQQAQPQQAQPTQPQAQQAQPRAAQPQQPAAQPAPPEQAQPQPGQGEQAQQAAPQEAAPGGVPAPATLSAVGGAGALGTFLNGTEPTPKRFVLEGLEFAPDSSEVNQNAMLDAVAAQLNMYPNARIRIDGYTDASGTSAGNADLSDARANAVKRYLAARGVSESRMTAQGRAAEEPVASNDTTQGRAQNRRVELVVTSR